MGFLREPSHVLVLVLVVAVLFGGRRLPDAARNIGQAMRVFKSEIRQLADDEPAAPQPSAESTNRSRPPLAQAQPGVPTREPDPPVSGRP